MYKRGSQLVIDAALQALGINSRDDVDLLCHRELRLEINTYLHLSSLKSGLVWVAANPDGERRRSFDPLCFWYPKETALSLIAELVAPKPNSFEQRFSKHAEYFRRFRAAQYIKRQEKTAALEKMQPLLERCLQVKLVERNVYIWLGMLASNNLIWVPTNPYNERRRVTDDAVNLWYPKSAALERLGSLHNPSPNSFEEEFTEISSYFRGFRTAAEIKVALVKEHLRTMREQEQAQLRLKLC